MVCCRVPQYAFRQLITVRWLSSPGVQYSYGSRPCSRRRAAFPPAVITSWSTAVIVWIAPPHLSIPLPLFCTLWGGGAQYFYSLIPSSFLWIPPRPGFCAGVLYLKVGIVICLASRGPWSFSGWSVHCRGSRNLFHEIYEVWTLLYVQ